MGKNPPKEILVQDEITIYDKVNVVDKNVIFEMDVEGDVLSENRRCENTYIENISIEHERGLRDSMDTDLNEDLQDEILINLGRVASENNEVIDIVNNDIKLHKISVEYICMSNVNLTTSEMESVKGLINDNVNSGDIINVNRSRKFPINVVEINRNGNRDNDSITTATNPIKVLLMKIKDFVKIRTGGYYKVLKKGRYVVIRTDGSVEIYSYGYGENDENPPPSYIEFNENDIYFFVSVDIDLGLDNYGISEFSLCNFAINTKGQVVFKAFGYDFRRDVRTRLSLLDIGKLIVYALAWISRKLFSVDALDSQPIVDDNNYPIQYLPDFDLGNDYYHDYEAAIWPEFYNPWADD